MVLKSNTTYREFEDYFLSALENNSLSEFRNQLRMFVKQFPRHYSAWLFLAKAEEQSRNTGDAEEAYRQVLSLLDPTRVGTWMVILKRDIAAFAEKNNLTELNSLLQAFLIKMEEAKKLTQNFVVPQKSAEVPPPSHVNEGKSFEKAQTLIKEGNRLFTSGRHQEALENFLRAEPLSPEPVPLLYIMMGNTALGLKDTKKGNRVALESVEKGFRCRGLSMNDKFALCTIQSSALKREERWLELEKTYRIMLDNSQTTQRKIVSIFGLIQVNSRLPDRVQALREWTDELLILDPANKVARRIQDQLSTFDEESSTDADILEDLGEEFAVEIAQTLKFSISPMLQVDIEDLNYTDPEILKKGGKPTLDDAKRLLRSADENLQKAIQDGKPFFVFYPLYLEAAKAFSDLEPGYAKEELIQRCLSRYASLRAGAFYSELSANILERPGPIETNNIVARLRDSAASYYLESLRLKLDDDPIVAGRIVNNYMKLPLIYSSYKRGGTFRRSYFDESFKMTAERSLRHTDTAEEYCDALLNIGAANPENFNRIFGSQARLLGRQPVVTVVRHKQNLMKVMSRLVGVELSDKQSINQKLRRVFDARRKQIEDTNVFFSRVSGLEFNLRDIQHLAQEWQELGMGQQLFHDSDKQFYSEMSDIIDQFRPYLERSEAERLGIVGFLNERISDVLDEVRDHPTYWGRIAFEPLLRAWRDSLMRLIQRKTQAIQPKIRFQCDPPYLIISNSDAMLNLIIRNEGTASLDGFTIGVIIRTFEESREIIFETKEKSDEGIPAGELKGWQFRVPLEKLAGAPDSVFEASATLSAMFREQELRFESAFTLTKQTTTKISMSDIPWNETGQVPKEMFKGRERLLEKLERHYLGQDRIETYVLFGLTRHGKSSIHKFLSERLLGKYVRTNAGDMCYLPFSWSFAKAADQDNAKDMWSYLIKDCIYDKLDEYVEKRRIPSSIRTKPTLAKYWDRERLEYRNTHLSKVLQALNEAGYLPFIAVDEFTFYTQMVECGMVKPSFLQQIREITLDEQTACFIFAGIYDLVDILKDPKYGITSQLANTIQEQIGPIDSISARELIQVASDKLRFTDEAVQHIMFASNNIPHFVQMICRRCGWYAVETQRNVLGLPEVELIISTLAGELRDELPGGVKPLEGVFRDTQFRPAELYNNAVLSTIAIKSADRSVPRPLSRDEMIQIWGSHRASREKRSGVLGNFLPKLTNAIETLVQRGVLIEDRTEGIPTYRIGVDMFRRWWGAQYPMLESELDKLIGADELTEVRRD